MNSKHNIVLLLTASINPTNTPDVAIPDNKERESHYLFALQYYSSLGYPIVFIDSSNIISKPIQQIGKTIKDFEYHSFKTLFSNLGKGHGEKEILDYAFENSSILKEAERVIKITGRYRINNLPKIIHKVGHSNATVHVNFGLNCSRTDSRMIIFKPNFYSSYLKPTLEKYLDEPSKLYFESVLARSVHLLMAEGGIYEPWPEYPLYSGVNGANGKEVEFKGLKKILGPSLLGNWIWLLEYRKYNR